MGSNKLFEIDLLTFFEEKIELVSCKDRSDFQYLPNLYNKIRTAANQLESRRHNLRAHQATLFVKVQPTFYQIIKEKFEGRWVTHVNIIIKK